MSTWIVVCDLEDIEVEDVRRFDHGGSTYAICRDAAGGVFATEGLCTHERVHLADGFVFGGILECPRHQGRFRLADGRPCGGPALTPLATFPTRIEEGRILIEIPS